MSSKNAFYIQYWQSLHTGFTSGLRQSIYVVDINSKHIIKWVLSTTSKYTIKNNFLDSENSPF